MLAIAQERVGLGVHARDGADAFAQVLVGEADGIAEPERGHVDGALGRIGDDGGIRQLPVCVRRDVLNGDAARL